ncbi:Uma2 family endonuclease [Streptomyces sp. NPDC096033]|uniref:Uma2 family endonuclease n=1 Tax=Streptomyces sp. NPDC096033 TaxID=3366071 RepID=UPI003802CC78
MTSMRPRVSPENFEAIARIAYRDDVTLEYLNGKIEVKAVPDGDHDEIIAWLQQVCMQHRPDLWLYPERGLIVETYRTGRARPDGTLAPRKHFSGADDFASTDGVLLVAEVTSNDWDTDRRDRKDKPTAYAEAKIPVFLLIDRDDDTATVHSEPEGGMYRNVRKYVYGDEIDLPGLGITFDTEELKDFSTR